jgi:ring-1,2-phenylacetyl-CoA epoxidase subunit PaaC
MRESLNGPDLTAIEPQWRKNVAAIVAEATLELPGDQWMASGGKQGKHTEHFGFLLAEMQHLQRAYPGAEW